MSNLLLQSCSASKNEVSNPTPAFELYSGYFYKILKKSIREEEFRDDIEVTILSAKYGILDQWEEIDYYDRQMDTKRARELNDNVVTSISDRVESGSYDRIIVNMGSTYRKALTGLGERVDVPLFEISGGGIGEKGHALHRFIRGDDSVIQVMDSV